MNEPNLMIPSVLLWGLILIIYIPVGMKMGLEAKSPPWWTWPAIVLGVITGLVMVGTVVATLMYPLYWVIFL